MMAVFSVVHGVAAAVSAQLVLYAEQEAGCCGSGAVGGFAGRVVAAGIPARVLGQEYVCAWVVDVIVGLLFGQLLDFGSYYRRCCREGIIGFTV